MATIFKVALNDFVPREGWRAQRSQPLAHGIPSIRRPIVIYQLDPRLDSFIG
jgi:hypothetical protein